jgi:hypothetical protein
MFSIQLWLGSLSVLLFSVCGNALSKQGASDPAAHVDRDGQHDFDFNIGVWHTHITRILDPLAGSTSSIELNGTVTVRKVWDGKAQLEEIEADGPKGHWEGLTLFLYNPQSHQWSQIFANSKQGVLTRPLIGSFQDGRGELFAQDTVDGRSILVRGVWSGITPDSHGYEESYSADGGKTWVAAFIGDLTRDKGTAATELPHAENNSLAEDRQRKLEDGYFASFASPHGFHDLDAHGRDHDQQRRVEWSG